MKVLAIKLWSHRKEWCPKIPWILYQADSLPLNHLGSPANAGDAGDWGSILGLGGSPGGGHGNLLQYFCLGNPMDRGAWRPTVHGVSTEHACRMSQPELWLRLQSDQSRWEQESCKSSRRVAKENNEPKRRIPVFECIDRRFCGCINNRYIEH